MAKATDKREKTWTEQSNLPIRLDMATEAVMSLMNRLASEEDLKMEFSFHSWNLWLEHLKKLKKTQEKYPDM